MVWFPKTLLVFDAIVCYLNSQNTIYIGVVVSKFLTCEQ